jgi:N-acetylglucosaminyl-diphospho-decaprenol L-rhamnosyltransferase
MTADSPRADADSPQVAIAVVSWNTRDLLRRCLVSLEEDARAGFVRTVVVDNGSTDGSGAMVRSEFDWVRLVEPGENLGFGRAVNLGLEGAGEPWLAAANADLEFRRDAIHVLVEALRAHPRAGMAAPRLVMPNGETQHSVHAFPGIGLGLAVHTGLVNLLPALGDRLCIEGRWDPERARAVPWAHGAFLLARRDAFEQIGGFDPRQWMYAEDIDLAWRMRAAGWKTLYEPAAVVRHEVSASTTIAFADQRLDRHLEAAFEWMGRRRGPLVARTYAAINWLGAGARAIATWPLARAKGGRFAAAHQRHRRFATAYGRHALRGAAGVAGGSATVRDR